jgi:hypothetical protein
MNAADTRASSAIALWTELTVVDALDRADRGVEIVHHGRDRDVHQRRVHDEHEHRGCQHER